MHTARSRNDQVMVTEMIYLRERALALAGETCGVVEALLDLAAEHVDTVMPGYTHMQPAKPTTFGSGVTFYDTYDATHRYGEISINGSAHFTAPTSGPMESILFFQDRTITIFPGNTFAGGGTMNLEGTLYFPNTGITFSGGNGNTAQYTVIVARTLKFSGSSNLGSSYLTLSSGSPVKKPILVE